MLLTTILIITATSILLELYIVMRLRVGGQTLYEIVKKRWIAGLIVSFLISFLLGAMFGASGTIVLVAALASTVGTQAIYSGMNLIDKAGNTKAGTVVKEKVTAVTGFVSNLFKRNQQEVTA